MSDANWDNMTGTKPLTKDLCNLFEEFNLTQHNRFPSRNSNNNVLEVVLTSKVNSVFDFNCGESIISSDHLQVDFKYRISGIVKRNQVYDTKRKVYLLFKGQYG